jgi:SAM-dependent methyltransferase
MTAMTRRRQATEGLLNGEDTGNRVQTGQGTAELLRDADRRNAWMLLVDGVPQSHVDLEDPGYLDFEYVRRLGHLIDTYSAAAGPAGTGPAGADADRAGAGPTSEGAATRPPLHVLHLGAGALTLARYVAATRPGSPQLAVEVDAALLDLVRSRLPLPRARSGGRIRVRVGDARAVLEKLPPGTFDVIIADVFAGGQTPAHLTSAEFTAAAGRALTDGGIFAANVADGAPLAHVRAQVATTRAVFGYACLLADAAVLRGRRFGNLVLAGSTRQLPVARLTRLAASDPMPARVLSGRDLTRFAAGAKPVPDATAQPSPAAPPGVFASLDRGGRLRRRS